MIKEQGLDVLVLGYVDLILLQQNSFNPETGTLDNMSLTWSLVTQRKWQRTFNLTPALCESLTTSNFCPLPPAVSI
jgi:hypothetical protein